MTKKGQITVPKKIRDVLGINYGEIVLFKIRDGEVILSKSQSNPIEQLSGLGTRILKNGVIHQRALRDEWDDRSNE